MLIKPNWHQLQLRKSATPCLTAKLELRTTRNCSIESLSQTVSFADSVLPDEVLNAVQLPSPICTQSPSGTTHSYSHNPAPPSPIQHAVCMPVVSEDKCYNPVSLANKSASNINSVEEVVPSLYVVYDLLYNIWRASWLYSKFSPVTFNKNDLILTTQVK